MLTKKQSRKFQMINYIPAFLLAGILCISSLVKTCAKNRSRRSFKFFRL